MSLIQTKKQNIGKNLEYGLKQEGIITFVRELNGNEIEPSYDKYLLDARMYARGKDSTYIWVKQEFTDQFLFLLLF